MPFLSLRPPLRPSRSIGTPFAIFLTQSLESLFQTPDRQTVLGLLPTILAVFPAALPGSIGLLCDYGESIEGPHRVQETMRITESPTY